MARILVSLAVLISSAAFSQDKAIAYYTLGNDTTIIQHFEFSNNQFQTTFIQFTGGITKCEATGKLDDKGDLLQVSSLNYRLTANGSWELTTHGENKFDGDSTIYTATNPQGAIVVRRSFAGNGILANGMDIGSFYTFAYMGFYAPKKTGDTLFHRQLSFNGFRKYIVARLDKDKIRIGSNLMGYLVSTIDKKGRLKKIEGVGSSLNIIANLDRDKTALSLLDEYARNKNASGINVVRTLRDTAVITLDNTKIEIDYWQPHKRGREIFGNVVPWGRIWRTGANNATQLRISNDIIIGDKKLAKGIYGLWSFLTEAKWELIVNKNANAWGTDHDPAADIFRIPYTVERVQDPVEILKIFFVRTGDKKAVMVLEWDSYKASVNITAE
ncbi:MAG TPA: DUF2911 domain-containing protein [Chitinophagaceae bacterium]|nr:DUF2911 domain-containing protein [Chitinophagaceae bacterium]